MAEGAEPPSWEAVYCRRDELVQRNIAGENLLVPFAGELAEMQAVWVLNPVAVFIWECLDGERSLSDIRDQVLAEFEVGAEQAESDVLAFVAKLENAGLIEL